jgi:hypothetical protein
MSAIFFAELFFSVTMRRIRGSVGSGKGKMACRPDGEGSRG